MTIDLGPLDAFPEGCLVLRKGQDGSRYACVRTGDSVDAVDDRCPHQGYPLSQGTVRDGVLTCEWHNWKFELATGACTFGGEPVRRYPTRVEGGRVHLNAAIDRGAEARRLTQSFREAMKRDDASRALREALRLGNLGIRPLPEPSTGTLGKMEIGFELLALDGAERAEYGFDHGLALLADLASWSERGWVVPEEAFVQAARAIAEPSRNLGPRGRSGSTPRAGLARAADSDPARELPISQALEGERRDEAEAMVRHLVEARGPNAARDALLPFASAHLHDYGHGAIFLTKSLELARRFPSAAVELTASVTAMLAWAMADTSLPPFTATRQALARLSEAALTIGDGDSVADPKTFEARVLASEREALEATLEALRHGSSPIAILRRVAHAAAVRLTRFDSAWERRLDAETSVLDVTHLVTYAEAAIVLAESARRIEHGPRYAARLALLAAGFVGKLHNADVQEPRVTVPGGVASTLARAAAERDVDRALAIARSLDAPSRRAAYAELASFATHDAAVRPISYAHTVKTAEALSRLDAGDVDADGAYLDALLTFIVPRRPESRGRRMAAIARKFLADGRPPEGLY